MAESVEELAAIIKDYAKRHKKLNERLVDLETKVFGHSKSSVVPKNKPKPLGETKDKSPGMASSRRQNNQRSIPLKESGIHSPSQKEIDKKGKMIDIK